MKKLKTWKKCFKSTEIKHVSPVSCLIFDQKKLRSSPVTKEFFAKDGTKLTVIGVPWLEK